jgi:NTP pyrophosphatase (non-canonical NTP hydrolase)
MSEQTHTRPDIIAETTYESLTIIKDALFRKLNQKGNHAFVSTHEILGVVTEEYHEVIDAVKYNNKDKVRKELIDLAVACVHGISSIDNGKIDW